MRLVYPAPLLSYAAPYTAQCFQNALRFHRALWSFSPSEPVVVILDDAGDYSNAGVWAAPRNSLVFHIAPNSFVYETAPANERINFTMNHEVMHVVAVDQSAGSDRLFRTLFHGKVRSTDEHPESMLYEYLTMPRRSSPRWFHEGIAVFCETWMSGGYGRAQGPWDEMVFRSMVRDSSHFWDPLGLESEGTRVDFQAGVNSYLYGTRFMDYVAWQYGTDSLRAWVSRQPGSRRYFSTQFRHVFGKSLTDAWHDWVGFEHAFQRANLDSIRRYPITPTHDLGGGALGSVSRSWVDSATRVIYVASQGRGSLAHISAIPLDGGRPRTLTEIKGPTLYQVCSLAWDPDRRRLYFTTDNNDWRDLRVLDPATGRTRMLIHEARIGDLAYRRQDATLWGVRHFNGYSTVVQLIPPYRGFHAVASFPFGRDVYDLDISPDGRWLSASMAEISGRQSLRLFDLEQLAAGDTTSRELHDFGASIPNGFTFSPDGRYLYGSSYYTGVSNIWRYDLARDSMDIVSNTETGLFRPMALGGDSLVVFRYTGAGFVPAVIEARPLTDVSAIRFLGADLVEKRPELRAWRVPSPATVPIDSIARKPFWYPSYTSMRPSAIYPVVESYKGRTSEGLRVNVSDPVELHDLDINATYSPEPGLPTDERMHMLAMFRKYNLDARFKYNPASFYDLFGPTKVARKGRGASLEWTRNIIRDKPRTLDLTASASGWAGLERLPDFQNVATSAGFDKLVTSDVTLSYKHTRASIGAADYEKGHLLRLEFSANTVRFSGLGGTRWRTFPFAMAGVDVGTPLPLRNASAWLHAAAGGSNGDPTQPFATTYFGSFGNNVVDHGEPKRFRDYTSLPGFEIDQVAGRTFSRAQLELDLPALRFERIGTVAFYASWARLSLFATALATDPDRRDARATWGDLGAQVDMRFQLLALQPLTLSFGAARASRRGGPSRNEGMISLKVL
jgi:WD40 repeat protein